MQRKIDWPNHLIGFVLIVFSILMAFQLERCSTDRREDRLVEAHLEEILEETRFNRSSLQGTLDGLERSNRGLDTLLQLIDAGADPAVINNWTMRNLNIPPFYLRNTSYQLLTTSGDMRLIDDFSTKRDIVALYEYHRQAEAFNNLLLDTYQEDYYGYLQQHFDLRYGRPATLAEYRDRRFLNGVSSLLFFVRRCDGLYQQHLERMDAFLAKYGEAMASG